VCCKRPCRRHASEQADEVAAPQVGELHSVSSQPGPNCRISNWRGAVSGCLATRRPSGFTPQKTWFVQGLDFDQGSEPPPPNPLMNRCCECTS
jgi:hypothetical protein